MYNIAKIFKERVEDCPKSTVDKYADAFNNAAILVKNDPNIVAILIYSAKDTATVIKRSWLLKYGKI